MATKATGVTPVWRIAALSRVAMVLLMLTFDALVDDYDTSGRLSPDDGVSGKSSGLDEHLRSPSSPLCAAVEGLVTWDAVYFQRISEIGYEHEQTHAFFPLIPAVTRGVASASSALAGATSSDEGNAPGARFYSPRVARCARAVSALLISNGAHVAAAVVLERLGTLVLEGDDDDGGVHRVARSAAVLFALNPASVFHSAPFYTESVFALAGFAGFYFLERGARFASESATSASVWNRNGAALCFALACAARSNGALNGLVLAHDFFARVLPSVAFGARGLEKNGLEKNKRRGKNAPGSLASYVLPLFAATFAFAARCATMLAPLFAVQLYGYRTYCTRALGAETPAWCGRWRPFPNVYAHVQSHYWNVGFLRYYEAKQIPNFLLAAPALAVSASAGRSWWTAFRVHTNARKRDENEPTRAGARQRGGSRDGGGFPDKNASLKQKRNRDGSERDAWMLSPSVRPYLFKWAVMSVVALLVMHVQVTTRFLSVTPGIYWFLAKRGFAEAEREAAGERKRTSGKRRGVWRRAATLYSISFFMLGALLFPTFYPWT